MRKILLVSSILLVLAIAAIAVFILLRRSRPSPVSSPPPPSISQLEAEDVPPLPDLSLQIDNSRELEVFGGTPLIFTVRVANQRAANAVSTLQAHKAYLSLIQEKLAKGEISASDAQPMLELARQKPEVKIVCLGTSDQGWEKFLHFEVQTPGSPFAPVDWGLTLVQPPEAKSVLLDGSSNAEVNYALNPQAAAQVPPGEYLLQAVLEVAAATTLPQELWRGRVASVPVKLKISPSSAQPSAVDRANMNMQRAEFFSTTSDWANALQSAQATLKDDPKLIRAQMIQGEAKEAQGDLAGARDAFSQALRLFDQQNPNSYEEPQYLIYKIATLDQRLGERQTHSGP